MLERLRHLPRDTRDTLFLVLVIACVIAPQVAHLPAWCSLLAAGVLAWRAWLAWTGRRLPSRWWVLALLALTAAATLATHRTLLGRDAGVTLIVVLLTLKTLELRAHRDAFVVFFLGFFTMLSNFFFSQSLLTAAAMLVALMGLLMALVNSHMPVGKPALRESARVAGRMVLLGAPVMVVLFLLFPRLAPLWGVPGDTRSARSGLSADMEVGSIASLALDDSIALRVRFDERPPRQSDLYFRGPVLTLLQGRAWRVLRPGSRHAPQDPAQLQVQGTPVSYQVTLEPSDQPWLFVIDATPDSPRLDAGKARRTRDLQWLLDRPVDSLLRYRATSYPAFRYGPQERMAALQDELQLPPGANPRTLAWAARMRADPALGGEPARLVDAALQQLRSGGYVYTLDPGVFGPDTADEFWFDRKQGFCEHIASSFVILMRALGIPARIVTGYQGGERNPVDGFWVVRQSDAHAWAEVWLAGRGWTRVDPTGAVSPGRIGSQQRLQAARGVLGSALDSVDPVVLFNLRAAWEALNNRWNQWVLNYNQGAQFELLRNIGFRSPDWEDLGYVLIALVIVASLLGALGTLWERARQDPWMRLLQRAAGRLRAAGLVVPPETPPRGIAQLLDRQWGQADARARAIGEWLLRLERLRYAPADATARTKLLSLQRDMNRLPWPR